MIGWFSSDNIDVLKTILINTNNSFFIFDPSKYMMMELRRVTTGTLTTIVRYVLPSMTTEETFKLSDEEVVQHGNSLSS